MLTRRGGMYIGSSLESEDECFGSHLVLGILLTVIGIDTGAARVAKSASRVALATAYEDGQDNRVGVISWKSLHWP